MIPEFLIEQLNKQYGIELTKQILEGYKEKRKTTLRINTTIIKELIIPITAPNIWFVFSAIGIP